MLTRRSARPRRRRGIRLSGRRWATSVFTRRSMQPWRASGGRQRARDHGRERSLDDTLSYFPAALELLVCRPLLKWIPANHCREQQDCGAQLSRSCAFLHRSRRGLGRPRQVFVFSLGRFQVPRPAHRRIPFEGRFWRVLASFEIDINKPPVGGSGRTP